MSMIWDAPLTTAVAGELNTRLAGARLRAHRFQWEDRELVLFFRQATLRWSLHPEAGFVTLHPPEEPPEASRPLSAELVGVEARPDERVLRFHFRKIRGQVRTFQVIVELMTNQWNALMAEGPEEWIRHILWTRRSKDRTLAAGIGYEAPDPPGRRGLDRALTAEEWEQMVANSQDGDARKTLLETVAFTSTVNLPALLEEGGDGAFGAEGVGGYSLWLRLRSQESLQPCVLETKRGKQPYLFLLKGLNGTHQNSILDALEAAAGGDPEIVVSGQRMMEHLDRALFRARKRAESIEREMRSAADPEECRGAAHLLLARLGAVKRGSSQATLKGFDGEEVTLALDPSLSPHENVEALYKEAARQERALERLPPLLDRAKSKVEELSLARTRLDAGEISPEEAGAHLPTSSVGDREGAKVKEARLPYRRFRSSGGLEIRVGKGSGDNDALTFQHTRPNDVWLHARDSAGAHVVLRWPNKEGPPAKDLKEAAVLAALSSRARGAGVVPVDWTRKKHVRKRKGAPPGTVIPDRTRTLFVEPDPSLPDRLKWED